MSPVTSDPKIMHGVPCFTGTRVPVQSLFDYISHNRPLEEFLEDFPTVTREHALTVLELAQKRLVQPLPAA